ncbi:MAG: T9SS type A sorting domain-containing protein, partial [Bacteroidetes bacterium]
KYPKYTFSHRVDSSAGYTSIVRITQTTGTSNPSFFTMPVDLRFVGTGLDTTVTVFNDAADQSFSVALPKKASSVQFDPGEWILRDVTFNPTGVHQTAPPYAFALRQNYPNPFNPSTSVFYSVPQAGPVRLTVHDLLGRTVAVLEEGMKDPGDHMASFDAAGSSSGVYLCRLAQGNRTAVIKMQLVR